MTAQPPWGQRQARRPARGAISQQKGARRGLRRPARRRLGWPGWAALGGLTALLGVLIWAYLARHFAPRGNTARTRFDAIIVLGTPAEDDGLPSPSQLARVVEAVHEYERGVAPRLIFTGGAAHNRFVEARVMAQAAQAQGIPEAAILVEPQARDTIQNACYSVRILKAHGWRSAEVISEAGHLQRAGLIFSRLPIEWRTHAAPPLQPPSEIKRALFSVLEEAKTARYLVWTRQNESCAP